MLNLIIFYVIFIFYNIYLIHFLTSKVKDIKLSLKEMDKQKIAYHVNYITRNLLSLSTIVFIVCLLLISTINYERNITPPQIGIALSVGTVVFFIIFLIWDIIKNKLINYFKENLNIEINDIFLERLHFIIISLYALILLLAVLSIISLLLI